MLEVWSDGAYSLSDGAGGWAWATEDGRYDSGGVWGATSQRMELTAALEAMRALPRPLIVVSDSAYLCSCFTQSWHVRWARNGWRTSAGAPVANRDLWQALLELVEGVGFRKVRGHNGDIMNERVDTLAVAAKDALRGALA